MELIAVLLMIVAGGAIAVLIMIVIGIAQQRGETTPGVSAPDRSRIAASILFDLLLAGGTQPSEALQQLRKIGLMTPVTAGIDIATWTARYAQLATAEQRAWLLEAAVQLVAAPARPVPLHQYAALLDLSFSLGFQTDALAKLREKYGFEYIDHAKDARPREADRGGGAMPLFVRGSTDAASLLRILGLQSNANRQAIITAYRKLAAQHHPDRVHSQSAEVQSNAAARFIEITRAYEALMAVYRD